MPCGYGSVIFFQVWSYKADLYFKVFQSPLLCWLISLRGMFKFLVPFALHICFPISDWLSRIWKHLSYIMTFLFNDASGFFRLQVRLSIFCLCFLSVFRSFFFLSCWAQGSLYCETLSNPISPFHSLGHLVFPILCQVFCNCYCSH